MDKLLFVAPHLSTGGFPQYLIWYLTQIMPNYEAYLLEYRCLSLNYVVQRKKVVDMLSGRFASSDDLARAIREVNPDVIHFGEFPENFCDPSKVEPVYAKGRQYQLIETTHSSTNDPKSKRFFPDKFVFCSEYSANQYRHLGIPIEVVEYPITFRERAPHKNSRKKILNVGLFTPNKNQGELFDIARKLPEYDFHFVGNQADNFKHYWEPLMANKPDNCYVHGEQGDVDAFYQEADLLVHSSKVELNPIVIKEALGWRVPVLMRNLESYCGKYDNQKGVQFISQADYSEQIRASLEGPRIKAHCCYLGYLGYNYHTRGFLRALNLDFPNITVRNFSACDNPCYLTDQDKAMLTEQSVVDSCGRHTYVFGTDIELKQDVSPNIHLVLNTIGHYHFYDDYVGPKIAYTVWETTRYPSEFFKRLLEFDQFWVVSSWAKECAVEQGYPRDRIFVVREAIDCDVKSFSGRSKPSGRFRFLMCGKWEHRKATSEVVRTFLSTFSPMEPVDLILNVDNPFSSGLTTEQRLTSLGVKDSRIKVVHFLPRDSYLALISAPDTVMLMPSRSEGWGIPALEAAALGIPVIITDYGAPLEYGRHFPLKVAVKALVPASRCQDYKDMPGMWAEPDFSHLSFLMRQAYKNYAFYAKDAQSRVKNLRNTFTWENAAKSASEAIALLPKPTRSLGVSTKIDSSQKWSSDYRPIFVTGSDSKYFGVMQVMLKSLEAFSSIPVAVYGVNSDFEHVSPQVTVKRIDVVLEKKKDIFYAKEAICLQASKDFPDKNMFIWIDGDSIVLPNIDSISAYFGTVKNYPLSDRHNLPDYFTNRFYGGKCVWQVSYAEELCSYFSVKRNPAVLAHTCLLLFNRECLWFFQEILDIYRTLKKAVMDKICWWDDEGIDNMLRWKYGFTELLPVSYFETNFEPDKVWQFFKLAGPCDFGVPLGWFHIPKNKSQVVYLHGNKDVEHATKILEFLTVNKGPIAINDSGPRIDYSECSFEGGIRDVAEKYGWEAANYVEVFVHKDYVFPPNIVIAPGDIVVDVGANIGMFTVYAQRCKASKVYSFEPEPKCFKTLLRNTRLGDVPKQVALSNRVEKRKFSVTTHIGGATFFPASIGKDSRAVSEIDVECTTLDCFLEQEKFTKIDFLKVDVEGAELLVFEGISDFNLKRVRKISLEYHNCFWNNDSGKRDLFVKRFVQLGFQSYTLFMGSDLNLQMLYFWQ